jgi:hypothetical protein
MKYSGMSFTNRSSNRKRKRRVKRKKHAGLSARVSTRKISSDVMEN